MDERVIMASRFKQQCLALIDRVAETKVPIVISKRGRPVAKLVPVDDVRDDRPLMGSVTLIADDDERYFSTGEAWEAEEARERR